MDKLVPVIVIEKDLADIEKELGSVDSMIAQFSQRKAELETKMEFLRRYVGEAIEPGRNGRIAQRRHGRRLRVSRRLPVTGAVMELVRHEPGLRPAEIAERILQNPGVRIGAKDPKKMVHQTILNLKNRGRLKMNEDGGVVLA